MLIRINVPELKMFLGSKDSIDLILVKKAVVL